eukprot:3106733-Pyramimonas_sp.AAC.1
MVLICVEWQLAGEQPSVRHAVYCSRGVAQFVGGETLTPPYGKFCCRPGPAPQMFLEVPGGLQSPWKPL